jgi:biopolymer transport protein ExbD
VKRFDSINVIPFIDIMLVLLAIVLTTATFIAEGLLDIKLPESRAASAATPETRIELAIDRAGQYFVDGESTSLKALETHLGAVSRTTPIRLRVDAEVRFRHFVAVVDLLKLLGMRRLTILTIQAE